MLFRIPVIIKYSTQEPDFCKQFKWLILLYSAVEELQIRGTYLWFSSRLQEQFCYCDCCFDSCDWSYVLLFSAVTTDFLISLCELQYLHIQKVNSL